MGLTDSKQILANLETEFKSLRKYCDPVYGEITVIQNKTSRRCFAMIEKTFLKANAAVQQHLSLSSHSPYLLKLERYEVCDLSLCSDIRMYFFLFEYAAHTLEAEIARRQEQALPFTKEEALSIFAQQVEIACLLKKMGNPETGKHNKYLLSNNHYLCSPLLELRTIEPFYRIDPEAIEDSSGSYLSPEAYQLLQQGETYRLREISNRESSVVFSMALNFLECLLLADLSMIYEEAGVNHQRLNGACEEVNDTYGEDLYILLIKMTHPEEKQRVNLEDLRRILKSQRKIRRSILQYNKDNSFQIY